ncbi:hypothetical protein ABPG72_016465 [Tetrahymena utriculariae]
MSQLKEETDIRKEIDGLSFVKFEWRGETLSLLKCTLFEPVYIFANKLFEKEDKFFKVNQEDIENTQKLFQKHSDQLRLQKDFQEYLLSDKEYIEEFIQEKRQQKYKINVENSNKEQEESKQEIHQSNIVESQKSQQSREAQNSHLNKLGDMDNLILVINEQSNKNLEQLKNDIKGYPELKNVINLSHFMNMNRFVSYETFSSYLNNQLKELEEYYIKKRDDKSQENMNRIKDYIKRALKGQTHIILFKEYKYNTIHIDELNIDAPLNYNPQYIFVYYAIAAKDQEDFNQMANHLQYYHKSSPYSVYCNIQQRLKQITFNTIKDAIRLSLTKDLQENTNCQSDGIHSIPYKKYEDQKLDMWNSQEECESLVYKNICSYGLLPINVYLNNQDAKKKNHLIFKKFKDFLYKQFKNYMPYPPRFHLNIQVMDKFYSYTTNSIFNTYDIEYKEKFLNFYYTKIRVLDYFPLDQWVEKLAAHFKNNLLPQMKKYFERIYKNKFKKVDPNYIKDVKHYYLKQIMNQTDTIQLIKEISSQFLKEYFSELKIFQKWSQILTNSESHYQQTENNCQTGISEFVNYITNVFEEHYESCDGAYNLNEFIKNLKNTYRNFSEDAENFKSKFSSLIKFDQPFINSLNMQDLEEDYDNQINGELLNQYQKFSSRINKVYLDTFMEPLIFETPIPKYKYFCEQSHKKYIELIQKDQNDIEKFFKVVDEFLESQNSANEDEKSFDIIKQKLINEKTESNQQQIQISQIHKFNKTHQVIINLIKQAQNLQYGFENILHEETQTNQFQLQNIISVLMTVYDSWYLLRKGKVNRTDQQHDDDGKRDYYKQYQVKDILNELSYYYYNSARLGNEVLFNNDDQFSVIGHLLIKNPAKKVDYIDKKQCQQQNQSQIQKTDLLIQNQTESK